MHFPEGLEDTPLNKTGTEIHKNLRARGCRWDHALWIIASQRSIAYPFTLFGQFPGTNQIMYRSIHKTILWQNFKQGTVCWNWFYVDIWKINYSVYFHALWPISWNKSNYIQVNTQNYTLAEFQTPKAQCAEMGFRWTFGK